MNINQTWWFIIKIPKNGIRFEAQMDGRLATLEPYRKFANVWGQQYFGTFYSKKFLCQIEDLKIACLQTNNTPFDVFGASWMYKILDLRILDNKYWYAYVRLGNRRKQTRCTYKLNLPYRKIKPAKVINDKTFTISYEH